MSTLSIEDAHLKDLLKQAILELMQERKEEFEEIFAEVIEDFALARAIKEGESTPTVSKTEVLQALGEKN
jgi:Asp-tRNA(Asn)/Glu-tRNA(Gln) amidotransferase C subunit